MARPCVLLVDDTPENIDILIGLLKEDYELKVANRGAKALQICQSEGRIDLILLDIMMPGMDGFEVCRQLRSRPATRTTPVLFLTSRTEVDDVVNGFASGGNDYLTKPFRPEELRARVRTHLMLQAQQREIAKRNAEMKEMLHILCHDVANHFAVLGMTIGLVESDAQECLPRFLPHMKAAVRQGMELTQLVQEMRRSEDKPLKLQPVNLAEAMRETLLLLEVKRQAKNIQLETDVPAWAVLAEPCALINSVLGNILSNAIKFSHPGGRIVVRASDAGECVRVHLRDYGVGMPPAVLEQIFDVRQSQSRLGTAGEKGTGFGMPLMHRFVTQFGGAVEVASREAAAPNDPEAGTEFCVVLRRAP